MFTTVYANENEVYLVLSGVELSESEREKISWMLCAGLVPEGHLVGCVIGPRREVVSPWSTNATDIAHNVGVSSVSRIERFKKHSGSNPEHDSPEHDSPEHDPMLECVYERLDAETLSINVEPNPVMPIEDIEAFNLSVGLALSGEEVEYLNVAAEKIGRPLTDAELFGFAQINSEHCRHKIFSGTFIVDSEQKNMSLFDMIKSTTANAPENVVSAYKDNVAFIGGPKILQFAPRSNGEGYTFGLRSIDSVIALKAETHNFPTTVEPFYGASTGSGGEIRDRMAGGKGGFPLTGTAVYMTAYPRDRRKQNKIWTSSIVPRKWKYQTPEQILVKASNGASDFGNKFGQPLTVGSLLVFEGELNVNGKDMLYGYDRTVMLAGGVGYSNHKHAIKDAPQPGDKVVVFGGDNYRIGMAGGSVSSVNTGDYGKEVELSAVQRANPEMQKRVYNAIRTLIEDENTPIRLIHDHGAGGHINCLSELLEDAGGCIELSKLPIGDPTLSVTEIICNESQERMGLIVAEKDLPAVFEAARRERAPVYVVGEVSGDGRVVFKGDDGSKPVDLTVDFLFGSSPQTVINDSSVKVEAETVVIDAENGDEFLLLLKQVLSLESVGCKDWLTNKVDRSVTGHVAQQQCAGALQLPLNNCSVTTLDFTGESGIATGIGHAPVPGLLDPVRGSILSVAESLTNIVWAPLKDGLNSVALSANWMWPAKQDGESARLYEAVKGLADFCKELGIAVPTGKDSLSMTMNYGDFSVRAPGTVVVSAVAETKNVRSCVTPDIKQAKESRLLYVDWSGSPGWPLGGSSVAQVLNTVGREAPTVKQPKLFRDAFNVLQELISKNKILAGHDVSSGGIITALCEMAFGGRCGLSIDVPNDMLPVPRALFCEKPSVVVQVEAGDVALVTDRFHAVGSRVWNMGCPTDENITVTSASHSFSIPTYEMFNSWMLPSYLLDVEQTKPNKAKERFNNAYYNPLYFNFPVGFSGFEKSIAVNTKLEQCSGITAAIVREQGTNGDREMAFALFAAGFDVRDITMSDLVDGRATLQDVSFVVFPGGFANSDVLGAARGWAGAFRFNERAKNELDAFYARNDTLSLGVCNGCQLVAELGILDVEDALSVRLAKNESGKFESSFLSVDVMDNPSVMLKPLIGTRLGIWVAHGEGRFVFTENGKAPIIPMKYSHSSFPANPNGAMYDAAAVVSDDGRHLVMMPHLERAIFPWQWGYYPENRYDDEVSPWMLAFCAAFEWLKKQTTQ